MVKPIGVNHHLPFGFTGQTIIDACLLDLFWYIDIQNEFY